MTNRLMELQDELDPPEPPLPDTEIGLDEAEEPEMAAATAIRRRQQARRPVAGSAARALASARPIRYRVPGSVPLVAAPGSMNTWAAAVTALLSWRERQVMGVEDALGRLGPRWVDLLHRNHGLPVGDKASLLAAAGLAADPPVCYAPDDLELLLRESGPLWVTDDDRGARLFSTKAYLVTGISAPGGRDARLDVIDPATGRSGAMRLSRLHRLLAGGRRVGRPRVQVLHLQQGSPNGHRSATHDGPAGYMPPPPVQQQAVCRAP